MAIDMSHHQPQLIDGELCCGFCTRMGVGHNGGPVPWRDGGCGPVQTALDLDAKAREVQQRRAAETTPAPKRRKRGAAAESAAAPRS